MHPSKEKIEVRKEKREERSPKRERALRSSLSGLVSFLSLSSLFYFLFSLYFKTGTTGNQYARRYAVLSAYSPIGRSATVMTRVVGSYTCPRTRIQRPLEREVRGEE
jgi:hypothetical protein